jgi:histidinol-phosphate aminotransferase
MKRILQGAASSVDPRLYPGAEADQLKAALAEVNRVDSSQVVLGGGGDQLIGLLASILRTGEGMLSLTPTFSVYPAAAKLRGIRHQESPLGGDLKLDAEALLGCVDADTRAIALVSPHNPTGVQFERGAIKALIEGFTGPIIVDEAYVEYGKYSLAELCNSAENLILLRTFSKAYGLAGMRLGYLLAGRRLAESLNKVQDPYPASSLSIQAALRLLEEQGAVNRGVEEAKEARLWLSRELAIFPGVEVIPSDTNFVTFTTGAPAEAVWRRLSEAGVAVRLVRGIPDRGSCLRVTVAPRPQMAEFLVALKEALQ